MSPGLRGLRLISIGIVLLAPPPIAAAADPPEAIGSNRILFVDDHLIAARQGVELRLHSPIPREVVFRFDAPWEGPECGYVTLLRDGDQFRMYYRGGGDHSREVTCVATSDDGVRWTRPSLGLFEFDGSKSNNILWMGGRKHYDGSHNFTPFLDANPAVLNRPDERYKAVTLMKVGDGEERRNALFALASGDGIHWRKYHDQPIITEGSFDSQNTVFWDGNHKSYVCYLRIGREGKRSIARATSPDFLHWSKSQPLDLGPAPLEHFYTNGILPYPRSRGLYLGFPMRFVPPAERGTVGREGRKTDGLSDAVFLSSRDGERWDRTFLEAFLRPGLDPWNWGGAHGNMTPAWGLLQTGPAELSLYWAEHYTSDIRRPTIPQLRRGTIRLDGFASLRASARPGEWTSKPLLFSGRSLVLNLSTSAVGFVRVELQDEHGAPLPGHRLEDCDEIWGDELNREVTWRGSADLAGLAGRPIHLRMRLQDADLYALSFPGPRDDPAPQATSAARARTSPQLNPAENDNHD